METIWNEISNAFFTIMGKALPDSVGLPTAISGAFTYFVDALYSFNLIIPASTILDVIKYTLVFEVGMMAWHGARFIFNLVRGSGA